MPLQTMGGFSFSTTPPPFYQQPYDTSLEISQLINPSLSIIDYTRGFSCLRSATAWETGEGHMCCDIALSLGPKQG